MTRQMRNNKFGIPAVIFVVVGALFLMAMPLVAQELTATESASSSATPEPTVAPVAEAPINLTVSPITLLLETDPAKSTQGEVRV